MPTLRRAPLRRLPLALAAALAAGAATAGTQPPAADPRAALLVTPAWLATHLADPDVVVLHVGERDEYDRGHLPGARHVALRDVSVSAPSREAGLTLELPPADTLRARLAALGVSDRSRIVVYGGGDRLPSVTRVLFTLDWAGLGARSALLDGGLAAWRASGGAVTTDAPTVTPGRLAALRPRPQLVVDADYVRARANAAKVRVVDARATGFYDGSQVGQDRAGHVPGARNVPYTTVTDSALRLRGASELAALFREAGVQPGDTVVAYCHIGQQATAVLFAARLLGHPVRLYDGSFQDWSKRAALPVETGAAKP